MSKTSASLGVALALVFIGPSACGGQDGSSVVVQVGGNTITKATVDHWTSVVRRGGALTGLRGAPRGGTPKQRALALLISSEWLIGEAGRQGVPVSEEAVSQALAERQQGGTLQRRLRATGQTMAGLELELRAELALEAIREELASRSNQITQSEVTRFYRRNRRLFSVPAVSVVDIVENLPSSAAATALVRRVGTGRRFAEVATRKWLAHSPGVLAGSVSKKAVDQAIFIARPGVASRPMRLFEGWTVFVVRKLISARPKPMSTVYGEVVASLREQRKRQIASAFENEYTRRWTAETRCRPGYIVPGCAQSHQPLGTYESAFSHY